MKTMWWLCDYDSENIFYDYLNVRRKVNFGRAEFELTFPNLFIDYKLLDDIGCSPGERELEVLVTFHRQVCYR